MRHGIIKSLAIALLAGFAVSCSEDGGNEPEPQPTYTVTVSATEGGTAATNKNTCPEGEEVTATATADEGYLFAGWYENGEAVATEAVHTFVMPARNVVLQARFEQEAVAPAAAEPVDLGLSVNGHLGMSVHRLPKSSAAATDGPTRRARSGRPNSTIIRAQRRPRISVARSTTSPVRNGATDGACPRRPNFRS